MEDFFYRFGYIVEIFLYPIKYGLGFAQLGGRNQLHRFCYLFHAGVALNSALDVAHVVACQGATSFLSDKFPKPTENLFHESS
jgi:hypothetical protein